jgi:hypothetical protein
MLVRSNELLDRIGQNPSRSPLSSSRCGMPALGLPAAFVISLSLLCACGDVDSDESREVDSAPALQPNVECVNDEAWEDDDFWEDSQTPLASCNVPPRDL